MPFLNRRTLADRHTFLEKGVLPEPDVRMRSIQVSTGHPAVAERLRPDLFEACANIGCRSGWLHLWRGRSAPVFEEGWTCSPECTEVRLHTALLREMDSRRRSQEAHRHRIPLGLVMLEQGWITKEQLRRALDAQKAAGRMRLGYWLVKQRATSEEMVTRALSLQWSCPVLPFEYQQDSGLAALMPRLFIDAFGALPLRVAAGKVAYLGFEECLDPILALAVERMNGLRIECGIVQESLFRPAHTRMLDAQFPPVGLVEAASLAPAAHALANAIERTRPVASRLVRVHDCLWLRLWLRRQVGPLPEFSSVRDVVCSINEID
jgi:hypothetical protein